MFLAQHRIGAVPVVEGDSVVGIFSERDFVRLMSSYGPDALDRQLDDVMTKTPVACDSTMAAIGALSLMTQKRIRHLPVVDDGRMVGFVSIGDLVKYRIDKIEAEAAAMRSEEHTSELQSLMRILYAVLCLKKKTNK